MEVAVAQDIEEEYLGKGAAYETLTERAFKRYYFIESDDEGGGHYRLLVHSNKVCLLTLAPKHPIIADNLVIKSVSHQANQNCNRLDNKVTGKKKSGAQLLQCTSILCSIHCDGRQKPFVVRSRLVAKLLEMNEDIAKNPDLMKNVEKGYIAIVFPKSSDYNRELARWLTEDEYLKVGSGNVSNPSSN